MRLSFIERIQLLEMLPERSDILTLKILRKLRESLSFTEAELAEVNLIKEYSCPSAGCKNIGLFSAPPICAEHGASMVATGKSSMIIPAEVRCKEKDIVMGAQAVAIVSSTLKNQNDQKQLMEEHIPLYEKFFQED